MLKLQAYAAMNHSSMEIRQLLKDHNIQSVCVNSVENFSHVPIDDVDAVLHRAREYSTICKQTDCKMFVCCPSPLPKNLPKNEALAATAERLGRIATVSAEDSIRVAFEFIAGSSVSTLREAVQVIEASGASNTGLIIDTFHYYVGQSTLDALKDFPLERLWVVHFNDVENGKPETLTDRNRVLPGKGVINLTEVAEWLKDQGWDGWLSVELFREDYWQRSPFEVAKEAMNALKPFLLC